MLLLRNTTPKFNLFSDLINEFFDYDLLEKSLNKTPIHDVIENDKEFIIELLLAGVKKEDISINLENDVLIIKAERKINNDLKYNHKESYTGKYERSFILPESINVDNISSSLSEGILKIIIPKTETENKINKRKIEIL